MELIRRLALVVGLLAAATCGAVRAEGPATSPSRSGGPASRPATAPAEADNLSVTEHEVRVADGRVIPYTATAGTVVMRDEAGKARGNLYFTAYAARGPDVDATRRPITFVFNGGPGAASVWLHLGVVGPRRIDFPPDGIPGPPPHRLVENADTWLAFTDLVLIDPIGTGYSRPAPGEDGKQFWGVEQDAASVADFIRLYLTRYGRWTSPKFLAGESYGTTRAARLSELLARRYGVSLNGIVFVSTVLSFQTLRPGDANDLPYVLFLPTYTYTAAYHGKLDPALSADLPGTLREVEAFAIGEYQPALLRGSQLPVADREALVAKLARYTGLPSEYIERSNLRVGPSAFQKQLLAGERKILGRFDGRLTGFDPSPTAPSPAFDPSYVAYNGPYSSTFHDYVRRELKFESDLPYEILTGRVQPWDFGPAGQGYLNVADELRTAMIENPHLRLFFAEGMYDMATPYFASDYTVRQLDLSERLRNNITRKYYDGGHMMYHVDAERTKLSGDVRSFYEAALSQ